MTNVMQTGNTVQTSYGTGPYLIKDIVGPCACQDSETHFHAICKGAEDYEGGGYFYLNGFRQDGSSVWSDDFLTVTELAGQISLPFY